MSHLHKPVPTFTDEERAHAVALLKKAKYFLASSKRQTELGYKTTLICIALRLARDTQEDHDIEPKVIQLIKARLGRCPTLRIWLLEHGYPVRDDDTATVKKVQDTRLRWMDGLIKELSPIKEKRDEQTARRKNVPHKRRRKGEDVFGTGEWLPATDS